MFRLRGAAGSIYSRREESHLKFVHLHSHTEYSLLDGSNKIRDYVARVKELGMDSAAITDHGVMYGVIDFYKECKAQGIRPILGCEVYVAPGSRFDREPGQNDARYYHLILLAENDQGYSNLSKIVSAGFLDGYYYKPRVDKEILRKYHKGIIASSACLAGEVARYLRMDMYDEAKKAALEYQDIFGTDNFFLELQDHGYDDDKPVNAGLLRLSKETGIGLIATNDCHYTRAEDAEAHDLLLCIQTGKKVTDEDRMRYPGGQFYVKSPEEMSALFPYAPEALENTQKIADRCNVEIEFGNHKLPRFDVPEGKTARGFLEELCRKGLEERYHPVTEELKKRLDYELGVIEKMGFVDYFLIVWDYCRFARTSGIPVGPGRGSAAGSLVSYTLGITKLDPIRFNLLFERFLNPERVSMPDIDVDFGPTRRQEVIEYVTEKYGRDNVSQIVTFGTLAARGVIRDVGRVMDLPYSLCDSISKMIPQELGITIDKALEESQELKTMYDTDETIHRLIDMARKLEGLPRHTSVHAAGVVICQRRVDDFVPVARSQDGGVVTQFTMTTIEELGLLKMDFLGLRNLEVIQDAVDLISGKEGRLIDIDQIDYDDPEVYAYIGTGKCEGIFQLESGGMKSFMKELKPSSIEDLIAGISLYRPGPMDFIPKYIEGKEHPERITYDTPQLQPILEPTYGCIVYQEQVMQIVRSLGGYNLGRADLVRRAMSKKKARVMAAERQNFVYGNREEGVPGCISKGIDEKTANKIYDDMTDFAKYAFNKSHAAAYAYVAYQTAWLKYYYPVEFMAALMTSVIDNPGKVADYIMVCRTMKIKILPPDINEGEGTFSVSGDSIRYGLDAIKSVGRPVIDAILKERQKGGKYTSLRSFADRVGADVNKRAAENFIKAGAFDCFGATRKQMMYTYGQVFDAAARERKNQVSGQMSLFDFFGNMGDAAGTGSGPGIGDDRGAANGSGFGGDAPMPDVGEYDKDQLLKMEKEVLGVYVSGHPLEQDIGVWQKNITASSHDFAINDETGQADRLHDASDQIIGGILTEKTIKYTRKGQTMAFIKLEDLVGSVEVLVFPKLYEQYSQVLNEDEKLFIEGTVSVEDDKPGKLLANHIWRFADVPWEVWFQFEDMPSYTAAAETLNRMLIDGQKQGRGAALSESTEGSAQPDQGGNAAQGQSTPGMTALSRIAVYVKNPKGIKNLGFTAQMYMTEELLAKLKERFGDGNVVFVPGKIRRRNAHEI